MILGVVSAGSALPPSYPSGDQILFSQADVLTPRPPCSATPIGAEEMVINGQPLPVRASMGMLTQPISFLGLPVVTVPCVPPAASRLACSDCRAV